MSLKNAGKKINLKNDIKTINQNKRVKSNQKKTYSAISRNLFNNPKNTSRNKNHVSPDLNLILNNKFKSKVSSEHSKKKKSILTEQNNISIKREKKEKRVQKENKEKEKEKEGNKYKHNKSLEEISLNNDILLQYKLESPLIPGNNANC